MIPYLEIRDKYTLKTVALVEPQEWWAELSYQEVGACEVYCRASRENLEALKKGRYITIPNKRFIWVITSIRYTFTAGGARMILASGYEAKYLLKKRCILTPKELNGTLTDAVYGLVNNALGTSASATRAIKDKNGNIKFFTFRNEIFIVVTGTQAPRSNLMDFVSSLLKQYNCGSTVIINGNTLVYRIYQGEDKTNFIKFSQSLDNLLASDYLTDDAEIATSALVVSKVNDIDNTQTFETEATGIDRAEILIESNISTKYEDANGEEKETTPDSELYQSWLTAEGKNKLAEHQTQETVNGEIDIANSIYEFEKDYFLGDTVRVQDEYFNFYLDTQITKYTFKQDANGYGEEAEYGGRE